MNREYLSQINDNENKINELSEYKERLSSEIEKLEVDIKNVEKHRSSCTDKITELTNLLNSERQNNDRLEKEIQHLKLLLTEVEISYDGSYDRDHIDIVLNPSCEHSLPSDTRIPIKVSIVKVVSLRENEIPLRTCKYEQTDVYSVDAELLIGRKRNVTFCSQKSFERNGGIFSNRYNYYVTVRLGGEFVLEKSPIIGFYRIIDLNQ